MKLTILITALLPLALPWTARAEELRPPEIHEFAEPRISPSADGAAGLDAPDAAVRQQSPSIFLELPLFDFPDNFEGRVRLPSMQQSLAITTGFYEASHAAIENVFGERRGLARAAIALFDLVTSMEVIPPFGDVWLHEEFHRAVMSNRGIDSFNDVYRFELSPDSIAVSRVHDEDLVRLKRDHPAEMVRMHAAGIEGEGLLVQRLQKQQFFRGSTSWHLPLYWLVKAGSWSYLFSGADPEFDEETDRANQADGANVRRRDFTGHDFNAWVYDLFRPHEPYEARGVHPSGVGIDRYRKSTHLTEEERSYLNRQGRLGLINFADPHLIGFRGWSARVAGRPIDLNLTAAHFLTSFGYTIDANLFVRAGERNLFIVLHNYANRERRFPGVEVELIDYPATLLQRAVTLSPRIGIWSQPENQMFADTRATPGGMAALRLAWESGHRFGRFIEIETKTAGWLAGNVHLEPATSLRFGLTLHRRN